MVFNSIGNQVGRVSGLCFQKQVFPVFVHCTFAYAQFFCYFRIGEPFAYIIQNILFALGNFTLILIRVVDFLVHNFQNGLYYGR